MADQQTVDTTGTAANTCMLDSMFLFKVGMTTYFDEKGDAQAATLLRYEPWVVSQIKTKDTDGYEAVQLACRPKKAKNSNKATAKHLGKSGFENAAFFMRELRDVKADGAVVGAKVALDSIKTGDFVKVTSISKGKGFAGVMKRWNMAGGPETHGSGFHRRPGSSGNRTWPGRVMPGKKFPGHLGAETVSLKNVKVLDVIASDNVIVVKGPVPGSVDTLVRLTKTKV
jgi:large subunit ribosomal protein L3